jgi:NAD(P)-dependent dehydrogenase (short-subunit alcohol dehydrogenase family)
MTFTSGSGVRAQEAAASYVVNEALAAMAQGLASALGPRVRVNVIARAFMDTALWRSKPREDMDASIHSFSQIDPPGRLAGRSRLRLHIPDGQYLHDGSVLRIDGGMILRK